MTRTTVTTRISLFGIAASKNNKKYLQTPWLNRFGYIRYLMCLRFKLHLQYTTVMSNNSIWMYGYTRYTYMYVKIVNKPFGHVMSLRYLNSWRVSTFFNWDYFFFKSFNYVQEIFVIHFETQHKLREWSCINVVPNKKQWWTLFFLCILIFWFIFCEQATLIFLLHT